MIPYDPIRLVIVLWVVTGVTKVSWRGSAKAPF
jgi:hypothetical protein